MIPHASVIFFKMERQKINEWIDRFNEGSLKGEDLATFIQMLHDDPELRKEVKIDREINRMLEERELLEFREAVLKAGKRSSPGKSRWFLLAAVVIVLLSAGGYFLFRTVPTQDIPAKERLAERPTRAPGEVAVKEIPAKTGKEAEKSQEVTPRRKKVLLAESFTPCPSLEHLVGETTRAEGIILLGPLPEITVRRGDTVQFSWRMSGEDSLKILFYDNHGRQIMIAEPGIAHSYSFSTGSYQRGLYYWKFLEDDQLVTAGKIRCE